MHEQEDATRNFDAKLCSSSASPQDMESELRKSGWLPKRVGIWVSPAGQLFRGPVEAYRVMKESRNLGQ